MSDPVWLRHYPAGVARDVELDGTVLCDYLDRAAERAPDRTALIFLGARTSFRELRAEVEAFASALARLGAKQGDTVAVHLPNLPQTVVAYYAILFLGARVVLTNPLYTAPELEHQWGDAGCRVVITTDFLYERVVRAVRERLPLEHVVVATIAEALTFPRNLLAPLRLRRMEPPLCARVPREAGVHRYRALVRGGKRRAPEPRADVDATDVAVLQYTGGTTGVSKGAMLTHRNLVSNVRQIEGWFSESVFGEETVLACLPLFHVFGMTVAMNWAIQAAATLVLAPNPRDLDALIEAIQRHRVTLFPAVPALFNALNHHPRVGAADLSSVKYCLSGSAPLADDVLERFESLTGARIIEGFGMSESSPLTHANPLTGLRKVGSVGIPVAGTEARVVDLETGREEVPAGEPGELVVRGPQVMSGYWQRPDETALTLRDGWLHTGDIATVDDDGYFRIVGRKKDMICCGGFNVFPDEVDRVLLAHPDVLEAATVGVPDDRRGETVKSFIVVRPGARLTAEAVEAHCRESLAPYKLPRQVEFLDELPKSSLMKILRRELRDQDESAAG